MATDKETREVEIVLKAQEANASIKDMAAGVALMNNQLTKMAQDDPRREQLKQDFQELKARVAEARAEINGTSKAQGDAALTAEKLAQAEAELAAANAETVQSGQKLTASYKEMKAAAAIMEQQLQDLSADDPGRTAMIRDFNLLQQRMKEAKEEMHTYVKSEQELREETEKVNRENAEVVLNGRRVEASFKDMTQAAAVLERQLHELSANDPGRAKMIADYRELQERIEGVQKEMGSATQESTTFTSALAFAGVTVGAEAVVDIVKEMGAEVMATAKEVDTLRSSINTMTGASGAALDGLTTAVMATARTFGKDYNEVLASSNTLSKQMGVSQSEALRLIQQGFLAGADAGGDFLDQVKEYAPQFKAAGYEADQFIGHISKSATEGIFSDKGADVVKEFGLRIKEQTKSTTDAMQAAFGSEFTNEIFGGIRNGSMTVQEALQRVSKEMDETKIPANQLQTVIADVFGGPGEDAGLAYLQSLKEVGAGVDTMVDKTNVFTQRQQALLDSQTALAEAQNELTKELAGTGGSLETLGNQAKTVGYTLLMSLVVTFKELFQPLQDIWTSFVRLGQQLKIFGGEGITARDVGLALGSVFRLIWTPAKLLYEALAWVVTGLADMTAASPKLAAVLRVLTVPLQLFFDLLFHAPAYFEGFKAAAFTSFSAVGRIISAAFRGDFDEAKREFMHLGNGAGQAFLDAYHKQIAESDKRRAPETEQAAEGGPDRTQGGDGQTDADRAKAEKAAKAARDKAERERKAEALKAAQERLDELKQWAKDEGQVLEERNALRDSLSKVTYSDEALRRQQQEQKILDQATAHLNKLTGKEVDYAARVQAIVAERDLQLRELARKFAEQDEKERQDVLDEKIKLNDAQLEVELARLELLRVQAADFATREREQGQAARDEKTAIEDAQMLEELARAELKMANGIVTQQSYDEAIFQAKQAARERELAYIKEKNGEESAEYKKLLAEKLKAQNDHTTKAKKQEDDLAKFKGKLADFEKVMNNDSVKNAEEMLGKQTVLYKVFQTARKALTIANIGMALVDEIQQYWATAATMGPIAGPIYGIGMSGLATIRAGMAVGKVAGFRKGGATGEGMLVQRPTMAGSLDVLSAATGMRIGTSGKLVDEQGYEVAGVVHKNEYVIPEWMRADPEVVQVESWLENRRQRGFYEGGPTSESSRAAADDELARPEPAAGDQRLVQVLEELNQRLRLVEQWPEILDVNLDLIQLDRAQKKLKQVMTNTGVQGGGK